jgi:hypothetical protein
MSRVRLDDRRPSITRAILVDMDGGQQIKILITIGFDKQEKPREVFCADFKAGTSMHAIVMDACILFSRLLQHGDTPDKLESSMCEPHSLLGAIAAAVASTRLDGPSDPIFVRVPPPDLTPSGELALCPQS